MHCQRSDTNIPKSPGNGSKFSCKFWPILIRQDKQKLWKKYYEFLSKICPSKVPLTQLSLTSFFYRLTNQATSKKWPRPEFTFKLPFKVNLKHLLFEGINQSQLARTIGVRGPDELIKLMATRGRCARNKSQQ